jgi:hypothetical protein
MLHWIRRTILGLVALALIAVLAAAAVALFVVPRPEFQTWVGGRLANAVGPGVAFGSVSVAFWPAPGIRLHDIHFAADPGAAGEGAASVGSLRCTLAPAALLAGEVAIDRIYVERLRLAVERDADGRWRFGGALQQLLNDAQASRSDEPAPESASGGRPPPRVFIRDGSVDLDDRRVKGGPVKLAIRSLDADLELPRAGDPGILRISLDGPDGARLEVDAIVEPPAPGETLADAAFEAEVRGSSLGSDSALLYLLFGLPIRNPGGVFDIRGTLSGRLPRNFAGRARIDVMTGFVDGWGIRVAAPMSLEASFAVENGKFSMHQAHLAAPAAHFAGYDSEKTAAVFDWELHHLRVESLDFDAYGGVWTSRGSVSFTGVPAFSLEAEADRVAFRELASEQVDADVEGGFETLAGDVKLDGEWTGPDSWRRSLRGSGRVELSGGEIDDSPITRSLFAAVFGKGPVVSRLGEDGDEAAPTRLEQLDASFVVRDGRAVTEDLRMATSDYRMQGKGSVGLDGSLSLDTEVALEPHGIRKLYLLAAVPFRKPGSGTLPAVPVQVSGTLEDPRVAPDVTGLSLTPFRVLFGVTGGTVGLVRDGFGKVFGGGPSKQAAAPADASEADAWTDPDESTEPAAPRQ